MKKLLCAAMAGFLAVSAIPCQAATVDDLRLYMGDKIWFKEGATWGGNLDSYPNSQAGLSELGRSGYVYTAEDAEELTAEAVARNIRSLVLACERQLAAREMLKLLDTIDSGLSVLIEKGRGDILPDVLAGIYTATFPSQAADVEEPETSATAEQTELDERVVFEDCDIGGIGESLVWAVRGESWIIEPFGYEGSDSLLLGVGKDASVVTMFNGVVISSDNDTLEIESLDKRLRLKYEGVSVLCEQDVYYPQGSFIGATAGNSLRITLAIDDEPKNPLEVWGVKGKQLVGIWRSANPDVELTLGEFDSEYHEPGTEIGRLSRDSYFNPEDFVRGD